MFSTSKRAEDLAQKNLEIRENKERAKNILETYGGSAMMASLAQEGGPIAKRIARELRRYESTGRVSNWLAGQTAKAESLREIPSSAVDDFLVKGRPMTTFQSTRPINNQPFNGQHKYLPIILSQPALINPHPWQIVFRTENDTLQFKVDLNSRLYKNLKDWTEIEVDGLNDWKSASAGFLILFGVIIDGECTEASIQGPQEVPSDRIEFLDGPNDSKIQNSFATLLGYFYEDENENIVAQQIAFHNFTLMQTCIDGNPALYPFAT